MNQSAPFAYCLILRSLFATVLELPAVCAEGRRLTAAAGPAAARVEFRALDATEPTRWPVEEASQDLAPGTEGTRVQGQGGPGHGR